MYDYTAKLYKSRPHLYDVGQSSAPSTSNVFQPTTDMPLNRQESNILCNLVSIKYMRKTQSPDNIILVAENNKQHHYVV